MKKISLILSLVLMVSYKNSNAQDKGRWIIVINHPRAITYVDSIKFRDFDARIANVGTYKVKSWRPGGILVDTSITVRKDTISFLKLRIKDCPEYSDYKSDKFKFQVKRWAPKLITIAAAISLQTMYKNAKIKTDNLEETYQNYKIQYDNLYNSSGLKQLKSDSEKTYNEYLQSVKKQNMYSMLRLIVPALVVTTVVIDFNNKNPGPYIETPLLTKVKHTSMISDQIAFLNILCTF